MSFKATWFRDKLNKKAKRGFQGYPVATITYYGPDDRRASKVSVGIIPNYAMGYYSLAFLGYYLKGIPEYQEVLNEKVAQKGSCNHR